MEDTNTELNPRLAQKLRELLVHPQEAMKVPLNFKMLVGRRANRSLNSNGRQLRILDKMGFVDTSIGQNRAWVCYYVNRRGVRALARYTKKTLMRRTSKRNSRRPRRR